MKNGAFYEATQTYRLPAVFANNAEGTEDVVKLAPEAGYLLTVAFPSLTLAQADAILTLTEGPGGGFLDNGSASASIRASTSPRRPSKLRRFLQRENKTPRVNRCRGRGH